MRSLVAVMSMLVLAACGADSAVVASDGSGSAPPMPTEVPAADGTVVGLGLVLDGSADGAIGFCLGPVAESYPPQCDGMPLKGWSWTDHEGDYDDANGTKFGTFAITGTFDGTTMTAQSAVPGSLYDPMPPPDPTSGAADDHSQAELEEIAEALHALPGALTTLPGDNLVIVDVIYDDGTLQDWADDTYGEGLVFVRSALRG